MDYYLLESNFCRNPDASKDNVWCFVEGNSSLEWDYCAVQDCDETTTLETIDPTVCGTSEMLQSDYRGMINVTLSGRVCQAWGSQEPHDHKNSPENRPLDGLDGGHNYCRNPDSSEKAWCYTTDPELLWEYCDIPNCEYIEKATTDTTNSTV